MIQLKLKKAGILKDPGLFFLESIPKIIEW